MNITSVRAVTWHFFLVWITNKVVVIQVTFRCKCVCVAGVCLWLRVRVSFYPGRLFSLGWWWSRSGRGTGTIPRCCCSGRPGKLPLECTRPHLVTHMHTDHMTSSQAEAISNAQTENTCTPDSVSQPWTTRTELELQEYEDQMWYNVDYMMSNTIRNL